MLAIRVKYEKVGRARFTSHLDVVRLMMRTFRRANLDVMQTQGFSPRPHMVFALPLPIFFESDYEIMDIKLNDEPKLDDVKELLNDNLPEGIKVLDVTIPQMQLKEASFAEYNCLLEFDNKTSKELEETINSILEKETVTIEKRSKKGPVQLDVKEYLLLCEFSFENEKIKIHVTLPSGSSLNISPLHLLTAIKNYGLTPDMEHIRRIAVYNAKHELFV